MSLGDRMADTARDFWSRGQYRVTRAASAAEGYLRGNRIDAFWYRGRPNFGDLITPALLREQSLTPVHADPHTAALVSTGSILQIVPETFGGLIAGSGMISDTPRRFPNAQILGVRGEYTRKLLGLGSNVTLGDPGLLAPRLLATRAAPTYALGVIPHYVDAQDERITAWIRRIGKDVLIIDVERDPKSVLTDMAKCSHIASSSLHGLVCADALGIPSAWLRLSDRVIGDGFKFADYNSALGSHHEPRQIDGGETLSGILRWMRDVPGSVARVQADLSAMYARIATASRAASNARTT